jgi:hypothetical protein
MAPLRPADPQIVTTPVTQLDAVIEQIETSIPAIRNLCKQHKKQKREQAVDRMRELSKESIIDDVCPDVQ